MKARVFREFYLRPRQIWRIWKAIPDKMKILEKGFMVILHTISNLRR
jgi:hypothetical protein